MSCSPQTIGLEVPPGRLPTNVGGGEPVGQFMASACPFTQPSSSGRGGL